MSEPEGGVVSLLDAQRREELGDFGEGGQGLGATREEIFRVRSLGCSLLCRSLCSGPVGILSKVKPPTG